MNSHTVAEDVHGSFYGLYFIHRRFPSEQHIREALRSRVVEIEPHAQNIRGAAVVPQYSRSHVTAEPGDVGAKPCYAGQAVTGPKCLLVP